MHIGARGGGPPLPYEQLKPQKKLFERDIPLLAWWMYCCVKQTTVEGDFKFLASTLEAEVFWVQAVRSAALV